MLLIDNFDSFCTHVTNILNQMQSIEEDTRLNSPTINHIAQGLLDSILNLEGN